MKKHLLLIFLFVAHNVFPQTGGCEAPKGINGEKITWYGNGKIHTVSNYLNGILHGTSKTYYENGNLWQEEIYEWGRVKKFIVSYYENGQLYCANRDSVQVCYYENGNLKSRTGLDKSGSKSGKDEMWNENGSKSWSVLYLYGKRNGKFTYWYENGQPRQTGSFNSDVFNGTIYHWHENGQLQFKMKYNRGKLAMDSAFVSYHPNGKIYETGNYKEGKRNGNWKFYHENGVLAKEGKINGSYTGQWKLYSESGKLQAIEIYNDFGKRIFKLDESGNYTEEQRFFREMKYFTRYFSANDTTKGTWEYIPLNRFAQNMEKDSSGIYSNHAKGYFENDTYFYDEIYDIEGRKILENGNGKYFYLYENIIREDFSYPDFSFHKTFINEWWPVSGQLLSEKDFVFYNRISFAKGEFQRGLKEGEWVEGFFIKPPKNEHGEELYLDEYSGIPKKLHTDFESPYRCYATGDYKAGKKEGKWMLYFKDRVFTGNFVNGKKEGQWKQSQEASLSDKLKEEMKASYQWSDVILTGNYINDKPAGVWKYMRESDLNYFHEVYFFNGKSLGTISENFSNGSPKLRSIIKGDTVYKRIYFSPSGDTLHCKDIIRCNFSQYPAEITKNYSGKFYQWNYEGKITTAGNYWQGEQDGYWYYLGEKNDTTHSCVFKKGVYNGRYMQKSSAGTEEGFYTMGAKTGKWIEYSYYNKECLHEITYNSADRYIHNVWEKNGKQEVRNGEGKIVSIINPLSYGGMSADYPARFEYEIRNGRITIEKQFYKNGALKQEIYKSSRGDSLAIYNSPNGSKCIFGGEGYISHYDRYNQLEKTEIYSRGKKVRIENYSKGKLKNAENYFYCKSDSLFSFSRTIIPNGDYHYIVEIKISLSKNDSLYKVILYKSFTFSEERGYGWAITARPVSAHDLRQNTNELYTTFHLDKNGEETIRYALSEDSSRNLFPPAFCPARITWHHNREEMIFLIDQP